ncbi:DUF389 domain-containing protein [Pedobacter cryotolerans]|uniref:DUF389 domain-containing protein n=1 Tax=Pedobacter cryotolerans TaxID=2571270 RepID=A0A4U1BY91_9SPHI|nr:DUF389 domain-containing protein [Pedobacter cryotolerans]TKB97991.1 DUF389 domain-containing protein [Pedobacter cryotolerans]
MIRYINYLFNLHRGEDSKEKTLQNVRNNISFAGANLWILACAILIASVGLNVNSTAVIIGAMLISPLMGPIVGSGFALGTFDFDLLKKALKNLLIATVASLVVSTVYFYVSPFKDVQSELLARTSPNIYDILIAFFGGLVGVIAVTRVEKGNPIPGVAIATALMPPLCTAGYGLATGQLNFFLGAFFLYSINCVFICIATYVIVKFLKYPPKKQVDRRHQRQVKYAITILTIIMLVPSTYFAYSLYKEQKYIQAVNNFINDELVATGNTIVYKKTDYKSKVLELAFLDHRFTAAEIKELNQKMKFYGLNQTKIIIKQDSTDNIQVLRNSILNEIKGKDEMLDVNESRIKLLEAELAKNNYNNAQMLNEAKIIFPSISSISIANHTFNYTKDSSSTFPIAVYKSKTSLKSPDKDKFESWLKERLGVPKVLVLSE